MSLGTKRIVFISAASVIGVLAVVRLSLNDRGLEGLWNNKAEPNASATAEAPGFASKPSNPASKNSSVGDAKPIGKPANVKTNYFADLLARADSGDPAAQFEAYMELSRCNGLETYSKVQMQIDIGKELGTPYAEEYVDYLWSMHDRCASIPIDNLMHAAAQYLSLAQQANHPAAVALQLKDIAAEQGFEAGDDLALQILQANDPAAILNTAPYLLSRRSTLPLEQLQMMPIPQVLEAALNIWACNLAPQSCGPWSMAMYLNCYMSRLPNCDPNEGYLDYLSHAAWSPDVGAEAKRLARKWQSEVEEGKTPSIFRGEAK